MNWSLAIWGGPDDEAQAIYGRADYWDFERARAGCEDGAFVPQARDQRCNLLQVEEQIRRHGSGRGQAAKDAWGGERQAEKAIGRLMVRRRGGRKSALRMRAPMPVPL